MLKGYSEIEEDATTLIKHYISMKRGEFEAVLSPQTGETPHAAAIRVVGSNARSIASHARKILSRNDANLLTAESVENLTSIAEELELAASEAEAIAHPDEVFGRLDIKRKRDLTERVPVDRAKADRLRARVRGDLRNQQAPPSGPPAGNGNPK